jgi:hypothetical protein
MTFVGYDEVARATGWLTRNLGATIHDKQGREWRLHGVRGGEAILADAESAATRTVCVVGLWKRLSDAAMEPHDRGETRAR